MNDVPIELDIHRGMSAQKETLLRRKQAEVQADQAALQKRKEEFEDFLVSKPAATQEEAAAKARYLIQLYADTAAGSDPRRMLLIIRALDDLDRLFSLGEPFS